MHIGKRTIKTLIAVLIGLSIYIFLFLLNHLLGFTDVPSAYVTSSEYWYVPTNFYTPFFVAIAVVYALQSNIKQSKRQAEIRSVGSIIGGYYGYLIVVIFEFFCYKVFNYRAGQLGYYVLLYLIASFGIVPLMKIIEKTNKQYAGFITCLTYFSVVISIRNGGMEAFLFTTNRVLSTIIGVNIAVLVNMFPHLTHRNDKTLFMVGLEDALLTKDKKLDNRCQYLLSDLSLMKMNLSVISNKAYGFINHLFANVGLENPVVTLNGSAFVDPKTHDTIQFTSIHHELRNEIESVIEEKSNNFFSYVFNENELTVYYRSLDDAASRCYFSNYHNVYTKMVEASVPARLDVSLYMIIDKKEVIKELYAKLSAVKGIFAFYYDFDEMDGYACLRITDENVSRKTATLALKEQNQYDYVVYVGGKTVDMDAMDAADYSICLLSAEEEVKQHADMVINSTDPYEIVKLLAKMYHDPRLKENYHR